MGIFRSDTMQFCEMYLQPEAAYSSIDKIGTLGCAQFTDMTPDLAAGQRNYLNEITRLNIMSKRLQYMRDEMIKNDVYIPPLKGMPEALKTNEMTEFENKLATHKQTIRELEAYDKELSTNHKNLSELHYVLTTMGPLLGNVELKDDAIFTREPTLGDVPTKDRRNLTAKTGIIDRAKCQAFHQMLWRISKGNIYFKTAEKDKIFIDPDTKQEVRKVAFMTICQPEELTATVDKVCQGFHATLYPLPSTRKERHESVANLAKRLADIEMVMKKTKYHRCKVLFAIGKNWNVWNMKVKKAIANYNALNMFTHEHSRKCFVGRCWVPVSDVPKVKKALLSSSESSGSIVKSFLTPITSKDIPPTFHRTNKFTYGFQALISAYGDSQYKEVNPALYTIITFPFLFAIMFGDFGHALIMTGFASWMLCNEKKFMAEQSDNEIWNIFFGGRYIILLMGLFSMYTGFLYNDIFSKRVAILHSFWVVNFTQEYLAENSFVQLDPGAPHRLPYRLGMDPVWAIATNTILVENSIKMKVSIIFGVFHMIFGLLLSCINHYYFRHGYAIILEFIPQLLFLSCLFLWLVILIYGKWLMYSHDYYIHDNLPSECGPLVLIIFIDMMLFRESKPVGPDYCGAYMFDSQALVQRVLLIVALCSVPVMLLGTPIYLHIHHKRHSHLPQEGEEEHSFSEVMIHQGIHTIEFVLSTISHTASYLRLWALSLAHSQLSEILWSMVFVKLGLSDHTWIGAIRTYALFAVWASFSIAILVVMEGLSAFLHTLRLHWVEFMSKFFIGGGTLFRPFTFKNIDKVN